MAFMKQRFAAGSKGRPVRRLLTVVVAASTCAPAGFAPAQHIRLGEESPDTTEGATEEEEIEHEEEYVPGQSESTEFDKMLQKQKEEKTKEPGGKAGAGQSGKTEAAAPPAAPAATGEPAPKTTVDLKAGDPGAGAPAPGGALEEEEAISDRQAEAMATLNPLARPERTVADLDAAWKQLVAAQHDVDAQAVNAALEKLLEVQRDLGVPDLWPYTTALVRKAKASAEKNDFNTAWSLASAAAVISPNSAQAHLMKARVRWAASPGAIIEVAKDTLVGLRAVLSDFRTLRRALANLAYYFLCAILIAAIVAAVVWVYRYGQAAGHDFHRLFPPAVPEWQAYILFALVLSFPLVLGAGPVIELGLIVLAMWLYFNTQERIVAAVLIAGLGAFTPLASLALALGEQDRHAEDIFLVATSGGPPAARERLEAYRRANEKPGALVLGVLALQKKREGDFRAAEELYTAALSDAPDDLTLRLNYANLMLAQNRVSDARREYDEIDSGYGGDFFFRYDRSQFYKYLLASDKNLQTVASSELAAARQIDDEKVERYLTHQQLQTNRFVIDRIPPVSELLRLQLANFDPQSPRGEALWRERLGGVGYRGARTSLMVFFAAAILLWMVARKIRPAAACRRCGRPASQHDNPEMPDTLLCGHCYHLFVTRDVADPQLKLKKELAIAAHSRLEQGLRAALCLIPGAPQLFDGRAGGGAAALLIASGAATFLAFADGWVRDAAAPGLDRPLLAYILAFAVLALGYIYNVLHLRWGDH